MSIQTDKPGIGFQFFPEHISSSVVGVARRKGVKAVFDLTGADLAASAGALLEANSDSETVELKLSANALFDPAVPGFLRKTKVTTVWVELHDGLVSDTGALLEKISELSDELTIIPVMGSMPLIQNIIENHPEIRLIALKGNEVSGFVGSETLFILYCAVRQLIQDRDKAPDLAIWGGMAFAEAVAAFVATGSKRIVFESVHWLTDLFSASEDFRNKVENLRPGHSDLVGLGLGTPCRLFDRGNSVAVKNLKDFENSLCGVEVTKENQRKFCERILRQLAPPNRGTFSRDTLTAMGIEAAFASSFVNRYGTGTETAIGGFITEIDRHLANAPKAVDTFASSPVAREMGVRYPFIQGAMTWITDNPDFARRIAEAGGLATIALGMMDETALEQRLGNLPQVMGDYPYAVNIITLNENPFRDVQLAWIKRTRPRFAVIAAGEPSHAASLLSAGIETIYIAPNEALLQLAFEAGVRFVICEGSEAGGHVGRYSTLTWAQVILDLKLRNPALFEGRRIILAGGFCNRETAFIAAMLGADAIQMGTAYLAVSDIIETGALRPLYQKMILKAEPEGTIVTGEATGLRVRSLKTHVIDAICSLERNYVSQKEDEASFRFKTEALSAGSLLIAARGVNRLDGAILDETTCLKKGQFMSGAAAGTIRSVKSAGELHVELAQGPLAPGLPFVGPLMQETVQDHGAQISRKVAMAAMRNNRSERIAITGMSVVNSLGKSPQEVWAASLNMESGIRYVPSDRWNHALFYHPRPGTPEKTYCKFGAFQKIDVNRRDIGVPPQDFRTMTNATRLTLWLASKAIQESGLINRDIPRERIAVLISQNSGEAAATLQDVIIRASASEIMEAVNRVVHLSPEKQAAVAEEIRAGRMAIDDTTLMGRLNCSASGFICNQFGFMGPSFSVSAACASSLVALYSAYQMIRNGVIDAAIVGGAEEYLTPMHFLEFSALGALAGISGGQMPPHLSSRPFDADRDGMVLGEGGGMIVIERESVARKQGARIHACITSMGASNNHLGLVESSRITQKIAIRASLLNLPYGPDRIGLVECHATATRQGDVEEVQALKSFFPSSGKTVLTSFKSQIGHTLGASGLISLIRGVMAMNAGIFPPTLNYRKPDPEIGVEGSGLAILSEPETWTREEGRPRRMQVNAFGFGGSNYVVQLEQAIDEDDSVLVSPKQTEERHEPIPADLPEGIFLFRTKIGGQPCRLAIQAESEASAVDLARKAESLGKEGGVTSKRLKALARQGVHLSVAGKAPELAFVFPGQGSHYAGMGRELYRSFPVIKEWMDRAASVAEFDLLHSIFHNSGEDARKTRWQQPALFTMEYAMAKYLWSLGIRPAALAGHSLGELTALCLAGVYSFEDGFRIVNKRAVCMDKACAMNLDPGAMMAVDAPMDVLLDFMSERRDVFLTNINSPSQLVIGGKTETVNSLGAELEKSGYRVTLLPVSMAFHSPMMKCIHDELATFMADIPFHAPRIPVVSNTTMEPFPGDPCEIRRIVMAHLESPVHWMANVRTLWNDFGIRLFVEVGPREVLCNLISGNIDEAECIPTCLPSAETLVFKTALARLFVRGNLTIQTPVRSISFPQAEELGATPATDQIAAADAGLAPGHFDSLEIVVQKQINSFMLQSFGRFLKPGILSAIRSKYDPAFSVQRLEAVLNRMFPGSGNACMADPYPPGQPEGASDFPVQPMASLFPSQRAVISGHGAGGEDVTEEVIRIIMDVTGYDREEIAPGMDLREDLSIRSSRLPVIMDMLEGHFGVKMEFQDFRDVHTVRDVSDRISRIMAREQSGLEPANRRRIVPAGEMVSTIGEAGEKQPIKRIVLKEVAIESTAIGLVELTPLDSVVVLSCGSGTDIRKQVGDMFRRDYGCNIVPMSFLEQGRDIKGAAFDPGMSEDACMAAGKLCNIELLAGMAIILDNDIETRIGSVEDVPRLLTGFFAWVKTFLESSAKKFVMLVDLSDRPFGIARLLSEGLLGGFLCAAHEFPDVLFRTVRVTGEAAIRDVIRGALNQKQQYIETVFEGGPIPATLTLAGNAAPIVFREEPSLKLGKEDVILFTGGCSGLMPYLAKGLVPYGCKAAFVGRTRLSPRYDHAETEGQQIAPKAREIIHAIQKLKDAGIEAAYFSGDMNDPESVSSVVRTIQERFGNISGVVHGAGILRDNRIQSMTAEDFSAVVNVKLTGAWRLFQETRGSIKFFVCLSSIACIQGNAGQFNYACANRAMSALMLHLKGIHDGILFKAFMLPPIEGAGMAENPDIKSIMNLINAAYIHVEELSHLFLRELFLGSSEDVWALYMRALPDVKSVCLKADDAGFDSGFVCNGMLYEGKRFPLIDSVSNMNLKMADCVAARDFHSEKDLWISDHKPFKFIKHPLVSAIMALECFMEAGRILHPTLKVTGIRDAQFLDMIECPPGVTRHAQVHCRTLSWKAKEVVCEGFLSSKGISFSRRSVERMNPAYKARILLGMTQWADVGLSGFPVRMEELDSRFMNHEEVISWYEKRSDLQGRYRVVETLEGTAPRAVRGRVVYRTGVDFKATRETNYQYSPYLLEALLQLVNFHVIMRDETEQRSMIPLRIGEVMFCRKCSDGEEVDIEARMRDQDDEGITWDARAIDLEGNVLMTVKKLGMGWFYKAVSEKSTIVDG
ncbi:type I polyketide synthase [Desulfatirhabdium butyrativorans]|uniref:type I polyketide synthase n=1 Tax=Desulfatirhabdium butyrativorans TaxID=340467 RepID=UPI0003FE8D20|nr:type I polyketide synthase [Desulfatirhabdium butyrativorans]